MKTYLGSRYASEFRKHKKGEKEQTEGTFVYPLSQRGLKEGVPPFKGGAGQKVLGTVGSRSST